MKERPILFNAEMVKAILSGRKTQTRRVVKPQFISDKQLIKQCDDGEFRWWIDGAEKPHGAPIYSKQGKVGDRLWVRETWGVVSHAFDDDGVMIDWVPDRPATAIHELPFGNGYYSGHAIYAADGSFTWGDDDGYEDGRSCWKPSIHMPRPASRIDLLITGVRVERLNDISEKDARAEGITDGGCLNCGESEPCGCDHPKPDATDAFAYLWQSIYGVENWFSNPWVWVIEFEHLRAGRKG